MDELEMLFCSLDEKEADELLKNISIEEKPVLSQSIKKRLGIKESKKATVIPFPTKKLLPVAATFIVVIAVTVAFGLTRQQLHTSPTTATTTTELSPIENPLMTAISTGNDDVIATLLSLPGLISQETMDFAMNFSNILSYKTIHEIALSVRD